MIRFLLRFISAVIISALLISSIPALSIFFNQTFTKKEPQQRTIAVQSVDLFRKAPPRQTQRRQPRQRQAPRQTSGGGPRFAMSLGVENSGGSSVPVDLVNQSSGGGTQQTDGIDETPQPVNGLDIRIPQAVRNAEQDASARLLFCVDVSGKPYNIKITEEDPPGLGLGAAARDALQRQMYRPAIRNGQAVAYCGMEQPVEIRFRN